MTITAFNQAPFYQAPSYQTATQANQELAQQAVAISVPSPASSVTFSQVLNESVQGQSHEEAVKEAEQKKPSASEEFQAWMNKSVGEKIRQAILYKLGYTEEELEALPPEEREIIEKMIEQEMKDEIQRQAETPKINFRNISLNEINQLIKDGHDELLDVFPFVPPHVLQQMNYDSEQIGEYRFNLIGQAENIIGYKEYIGENASYYRTYLEKLATLANKLNKHG